MLLQQTRDTLIIELASAPGGTDLKRAEELHLHVIDAPSLPGRVAPKTAAEYIKEAVYNILESSDRHAHACLCHVRIVLHI